MRTAKICLPILLCIIYSNSLSAANRFWVGIGIFAGNWNNISYWSASSGGLGGASVPGVGDFAIFDGGFLGVSQRNCTVDVAVNVIGITVTGAYNGTIVQGANTINVSGAASFGGGTFTGGSANITIGGAFTLSATAFTSTTAILELRGDAAFTGGSFTHNNGWMRFNDAAAQTISGTSPVFYDLEFVGTGNSYNLSSAGNIGVVHNLNISGVSSCTLNTGGLDVSGDIILTNTSTGDGGTSTINIIGASNKAIISAVPVNQSTLPSVNINKSGGGTLTLPALITVMGNWTYTAGVIDAVLNNSTVVFDNTLTITGNHTLNNVTFEGNNNWTFTINTGTLLTVAGTLTTTGSSNIFINAGVAGATVIQAQGNIIINNTSAAGGGQGLILINGTGPQALTSTAASGQGLLPYIKIQKTPGTTLTLNGTISESRDWTYISGTVAPTTSSVVFGGNSLSITSAGMNFYNVAVVANTSTLLNNLSVNNNLTISGSAILAAGSNTINLSGNWTNWGAGGFAEATSTVNLNGTGLQTVSSAGGEIFANLAVNNSGTGIQFMNNVTVGATLTMTQGNINLSGSMLTLGLSTLNKGTLVYSAGNLYGTGSFTRWFNASTIADGSVTGLFPMGTAVDSRPFYVSAPSTGPTTGGTITIAYTDATTNTSIPTYMDGASTIMVRKDLNWAASTANGLAGGTYNLDARGTNFGIIGNVSDLRLTLANNVAGLPGVNAGTVSNPQVNRTGLTLANLTNTFYVGSINSVSSPLPVALISFTVSLTGSEVVLNWITASEIENAYFEVQRSADGTGWEDIEKIAGVGNSNTDQSYNAYDHTPYSGISYYRLVQVDNDGRKTFSATRTISFGKQSGISVYPNPAIKYMTVGIPISGKYEITLLNSAGQSMNRFEVNSGGNTIINISNMAAGIYFIRVRHENITETREMLIVK